MIILIMWHCACAMGYDRLNELLFGLFWIGNVQYIECIQNVDIPFLDIFNIFLEGMRKIWVRKRWKILTTYKHTIRPFSFQTWTETISKGLTSVKPFVSNRISIGSGMNRNCVTTKLHSLDFCLIHSYVTNVLIINILFFGETIVLGSAHILESDRFDRLW